jgi:hypothetical protein
MTAVGVENDEERFIWPWGVTVHSSTLVSCVSAIQINFECRSVVEYHTELMTVNNYFVL